MGAIGLFLRYLIQRDMRNETRAQKREDDMSVKLGSVEDFQRNEMTGLVTRTTQVVERNTAALQDFGEVVKGCKERNE